MKKKTLHLVPRSLLALLLTCGLAVAANSPQLHKIEHTILSPASEQVVLQLNGSYSPKVFTLKGETPRVIFDFADMVHTREIKSITTTNGPIVKRVRVGMHTDASPKTRVVLDLTTLKGVSYTQKFDEKSTSLVIELTGPKKMAAHPAPKAESVEKTAEVQPANVSETQPGKTAQVDPNAPFHSPQKQTDRVEVLPEQTAKEQSAGGQQPPEPVVEAAGAAQADSRKSGAEMTQSPLKAASGSTAEKTEEKALAKPQIPSPVETAPEAIPAEKAAPLQATDDAKRAAAIESPTTPPSTDEKKEEGKKTKIAGVTQEPPSKENSVEPPAIAKKEAAATDANSKTETAKEALPVGPELEYVKFDATSPKGEMVVFKLNGFHPPTVHGVEEGIPRVICDFNNTKLTGSSKNQIKADGKFVKVIRTSKTRKPEKVRVVIDLEPNRSYDLQQVFFKEDNLFVIIVNTLKK